MENIFNHKYIPQKSGILAQYDAIKRQGKCVVRIIHVGARKAVQRIWRTPYGPQTSHWHLLPENYECRDGQWCIPTEKWEEMAKVSERKSRNSGEFMYLNRIQTEEDHDNRAQELADREWADNVSY